jgi:hypothetical protein
MRLNGCQAHTTRRDREIEAGRARCNAGSQRRLSACGWKGAGMLALKSKADLEALHTGNVKESISLEYKASPAIDKKDDNKKLEMARDVAAFANADGGQIVYGMTEKDHEPAGLDEGVDGKAYPEIWFEQVLQQHIKPTIAGLRIKHVYLTKPMVAVVIDIPPTKGDPHQVSDGRYYRRHNYNRLIMEHYEVRDGMRRITDPSLELEFELFKGEAAYKNVEFSKSERSNCACCTLNQYIEPTRVLFSRDNIYRPTSDNRSSG